MPSIRSSVLSFSIIRSFTEAPLEKTKTARVWNTMPMPQPKSGQKNQNFSKKPPFSGSVARLMIRSNTFTPTYTAR
jgi:hypothetical protein